MLVVRISAVLEWSETNIFASDQLGLPAEFEF